MNLKSLFGAGLSALALWFAPGASTCAFAADVSTAAPEDWEYSFRISLGSEMKAAVGSGSETNFPILVRLSEAEIDGFKYGNFEQSDYSDLIFVDAEDNFLEYEVDTWNPSGTSLVWVRVPALRANSAVICCYGGRKYSHESSRVWEDYIGVWHMNEASGTVADATGNGYTATPAKGEWGDLDQQIAVDGVVGNARQNGTKNTKYGNYLSIPSYDKEGCAGVFTYSAWYKLNEVSGHPRLVSRKEYYKNENGWEAEMYDGSPTTVTARGSKDDEGKYLRPDNYPSFVADWVYLTLVYNGPTLTMYGNGEQLASGEIMTAGDTNLTLSIGCNSNGTEEALNGQYDEARLSKGTMTSARVKLDYLNMKNTDALVYGAVQYLDPEAPFVKDLAVTADDAGYICVTGRVTRHSGTVTVTLMNDEYGPLEFDLGEIAVDGWFGGVYGFTNDLFEVDYLVKITADNGGKRYVCTAENPVRIQSPSEEDGPEVGTPTIVSDGSGGFTASVTIRNEMPRENTVKLYLNGKCIPMTTTDDAVPATYVCSFPSPSSGKIERALVRAVSEAGALHCGGWSYFGTGELTGDNIWVAEEAGLASDGANWSRGVAPTATDIVIFDGDVSTVDCEWNADATFTVAGWRQNASYTGTVTIDTTYESGEHPQLTVNGDMTVLGGTLTHLANVDDDTAGTYRLKIVTSGGFDLGSEAKIDASLRGFRGNCYPSGSTYGAHAASGDGYSYVYGDVYRPSALGAGGSGVVARSGGGAVWLECGGKAVIDGKINVRGYQGDTQNAACGSVYLKATECTGSGTILADFDKDGYDNGGRGSAGRVAIELTEAKTLGLPVDNVEIDGCCSGGSAGGGGTFFVKTAADEHGTLYLDDTRAKSYGARWQKWKAITAIPQGANWTFDKIVISGWGMLAVPENTGLSLPKGGASVSANSTRQGGIFYNGGTLDFGETRPFRFSGDWIFQANANYVFDGDVSIGGGAAFGCMRYGGATDFSDHAVCDITVKGDLTIDSDGYVYAVAGGPDLPLDRVDKARHGGMSANYGTSNAAYDSIFDPVLPGYGLAHGDRATSCAGGGAVRLEVTGTLENNGVMNADGGAYSSDVGAAGGTINITADDLIGKGAIYARAAQSGKYGNGGGGRIAIRLGENAECTDKVFNNISACGYTVTSASAANSSDGTIYLYVADGLGIENGTIYVRGDGKSGNDNTFTPIPVGNNSYSKDTETAEQLKAASLTIEGAATVKLMDTLENATLNIYDNCLLDLNGRVYTVRCAYVNGEKVPVGDYKAGDTTFEGMLIDSVGGGKLHVTGYGLWVFVQ